MIRPSSINLTRNQICYAYDAQLDPAAEVLPGTSVVFETLDGRGGALSDRPTGSTFELPAPDPARSNPLTGPLFVTGAESGDALVVDILSIELLGPGWTGAHAHLMEPEKGAQSFGRICSVENGVIAYSKKFSLPTRPMIGCIGTAPVGDPVPAVRAGRFGGNLDQPPIGVGTRVYLPVAARGGGLFIGDTHAAQGDGEVAGSSRNLGIEIQGIEPWQVEPQRDFTSAGAPNA